MSSRTARHGDPREFSAAVSVLGDVRLRPGVTLTEMPAPQRIAPHSVALSAEVVRAAGEDPVATGRFVLLHDPSGPEAWEGTWRIVSYARAELEPELGTDPLLGDIGWAWLTETLTESLTHSLARSAEQAGAPDAGEMQGDDRAPAEDDLVALGGTVTRVVSESYGSLEDNEASVELEIRASWTPDPRRLADHLVAWTEALCTIGGLPPLPEGVTSLNQRRQ